VTEPLEQLPHGRVPPHNLDAERSVLGGVLLTHETFDDVVSLVSPEDFYRDAHRKIFAAMIALSTKAIPIDHVSLLDALTAAGDLESVGGADFIRLLDKFTPTASNLGYYAKIVREKAATRRTIEAAGVIAQLGYEQHGEVSQFLDDAQRRILTAADLGNKAQEPEHVKTTIARAFKEIERDYERNAAVTGIESGLPDLDRMTCGWQNQDLIILAARPSVGKTTSGMQFVRHAATRLNKPSLFFSLEQSKEKLVKKSLAAESRIDAHRIRTGKLHESDWGKIANSAGRLADAPLFIDDEQGLTALQIRAKARKVARKLQAAGNPLALVAIDFLGEMSHPDNGDTYSRRVGESTLQIKHLANELNIPVLLLCQLNRESMKGGVSRRPGKADLRDSGEIEQRADVIIFIHVEQDRYLFIVDKQRDGETGDVPVVFDKVNQRFESADYDRQRFADSGEAA
jgi:replicative DNA helicase